MALRRRGAPAIGESAVDGGRSSACNGGRGRDDGLETHVDGVELYGETSFGTFEN